MGERYDSSRIQFKLFLATFLAFSMFFMQVKTQYNNYQNNNNMQNNNYQQNRNNNNMNSNQNMNNYNENNFQNNNQNGYNQNNFQNNNQNGFNQNGFDQNGSNQVRFDENGRRIPLTPEQEDDMLDRSRPPILTQRQQEDLNNQWHPPGHASPMSPAYAGYRGPNKAVLKPEEATLSLEIFPLYYTPITRSSSFRLNFSSNVMRKRDITFEVYYSMTRYINFHYHPTKVKLQLWNNVYWIEFFKPVMVDEFDVMRSFEYTEAKFKNLFVEMPIINTKEQNMIFLDPQRRYSFKAFNVRKIAETKGRVLCKEKIRRVRGYQLLKRLMEERRRRQQQELDRIDKMEREMDESRRRSQNMQQTSRKLKVVKKTGTDSDEDDDLGKNRKKTKEEENEEKEDFKTTIEEIKDGKRAMLLLYGRKYIREIIIVCEIK